MLHVAHAKDMQSARSFEHKLIWSILTHSSLICNILTILQTPHCTNGQGCVNTLLVLLCFFLDNSNRLQSYNLWESRVLAFDHLK
jgi:hypothetical protein